MFEQALRIDGDDLAGHECCNEEPVDCKLKCRTGKLSLRRCGY